MARPVSPRGTGRERVLDAAMTLFAEHGVSGTSLQMIAEAMGVTKAAVYYQFRTKEEIVVAVLAGPLGRLEAVLDEAEAEPDRQARLDIFAAGMIDIVLENRPLAAAMHSDPVIGQTVKAHAPYCVISERLVAVLLGPSPSPRTLVAVSLFLGGLMLSGSDEMLRDLDDDTLREELRQASRSLLAAA